LFKENQNHPKYGLLKNLPNMFFVNSFRKLAITVKTEYVKILFVKGESAMVDKSLRNNPQELQNMNY
jgi:hypothetical protein